jgi:2,4-dienoyl-CoA reductase-like NADH-dependent reductase (Old Yellow Enzyme family)/thioredoxin reductase
MTVPAGLAHVLAPGRIAGCEVPNRVVRTAHGTVLGGRRQLVTDDFVAYHEAAARGGAGLSILEIGSVHRTTVGGLRVYDDAIIDGYQALMERMQPHGMRVFQQLWHGGAQAGFYTAGPPWSASQVQPTPRAPMPIAMSESQIAEIVAAFADAARRVVAGGLDGLELHFAHGYLVQQFLSPLSNCRTDAYGGDEAGRLRFGLEVAAAVREAVPDGFPVGVRLSSEETPGGLDAAANTGIALALEAAGLIDFVDLSAGSYFHLEKFVGGMYEPPGYQLAESVPVARAISVPAIVSGRITTLAEAERIVAAGDAAFVGLTRAQLADPELVAKTGAGRAQDVRPCIACDTCVAAMNAGRIACAVNPVAGRERHVPTGRAPARRRVVVAGAGPAGLEAARTAALRGHEVILLEAGDVAGGQARIASLAPSRDRIGALLDWFDRQVESLGVDLRMGTPATPELVAELEPEAVIVATGSVPRLDGIQWGQPGEPLTVAHGARLTSSWDVLTAERPWSGSAVVVDDTGHYEAAAAAERLATDGAAVTFVTRHSAFLVAVEANFEPRAALRRLRAHNFALHTRCLAVQVRPGQVDLRYLDGGAPFTVPADVVVFVSGNVSRNELAAGLEAAGHAPRLAGDALSQRYLRHAIADGFDVASSI